LRNFSRLGRFIFVLENRCLPVTDSPCQCEIVAYNFPSACNY
jgi:hypothetical protein